MTEKVDLAEKLALVDEAFQPKIVGRYNVKVMVGKIRGEFAWDSHADTDDFLLVLEPTEEEI